ncbi:uncharacterized protein A1O5_02518 [Cladophialophora psammophila CBS 110553]|uniref:Uncharacterized protein n=1 Tax=Cladophialophora psammophila CBS 110553 TaxID=1182543 RepID=W9X1Z6_9EURO|nr:uncharacterized protein A1O5_02518 [Cladophialophora psammophila CBS 110553]EXJ74223.1 hypothetical protein A1O5_02518 [Cladophialophora psammophila CBS 110553]
MAGSAGTWLLPQWTLDMCVLDGVDPSVLTMGTRPGNKTGRRIGVNFARIGLPKFAFGPVFNSLNLKYEGFMGRMTETGVTTSVGQFVSVDPSTREVGITIILPDVMRKLAGRSALRVATVAISVTFGALTDEMGT